MNGTREVKSPRIASHGRKEQNTPTPKLKTSSKHLRSSRGRFQAPKSSKTPKTHSKSREHLKAKNGRWSSKPRIYERSGSLESTAEVKGKRNRARELKKKKKMPELRCIILKENWNEKKTKKLKEALRESLRTTSTRKTPHSGPATSESAKKRATSLISKNGTKSPIRGSSAMKDSIEQLVGSHEQLEKAKIINMGAYIPEGFFKKNFKKMVKESGFTLDPDKLVEERRLRKVQRIVVRLNHSSRPIHQKVKNEPKSGHTEASLALGSTRFNAWMDGSVLSPDPAKFLRPKFRKPDYSNRGKSRQNSTNLSIPRHKSTQNESSGAHPAQLKAFKKLEKIVWKPNLKKTKINQKPKPSELSQKLANLSNLEQEGSVLSSMFRSIIHEHSQSVPKSYKIGKLGIAGIGANSNAKAVRLGSKATYHFPRGLGTHRINYPDQGFKKKVMAHWRRQQERQGGLKSSPRLRQPSFEVNLSLKVGRKEPQIKAPKNGVEGPGGDFGRGRGRIGGQRGVVGSQKFPSLSRKRKSWLKQKIEKSKEKLKKLKKEQKARGFYIKKHQRMVPRSPKTPQHPMKSLSMDQNLTRQRAQKSAKNHPKDSRNGGRGNLRPGNNSPTTKHNQEMEKLVITNKPKKMGWREKRGELSLHDHLQMKEELSVYAYQLDNNVFKQTRKVMMVRDRPKHPFRKLGSRLQRASQGNEGMFRASKGDSSLIYPLGLSSRGVGSRWFGVESQDISSPGYTSWRSPGRSYGHISLAEFN